MEVTNGIGMSGKMVQQLSQLKMSGTNLPITVEVQDLEIGLTKLLTVG